MRIITIVLLLLSSKLICAQQDSTWGYIKKHQVDSLRKLLVNSQDDTVKMGVCRLLGFYYQENKADSSLFFHDLQLELSKI